MVRKAALQAVQLVVQSNDQASSLPMAACHWPLYIRLAETLCSILTAAPDSSLASQELQQASCGPTSLFGCWNYCLRGECPIGHPLQGTIGCSSNAWSAICFILSLWGPSLGSSLHNACVHAIHQSHLQQPAMSFRLYLCGGQVTSAKFDNIIMTKRVDTIACH